MKKLILAVVSIAMLAACQPKGYTVTGTIEGAENGKVVLQCIREGRPMPLDTAEIIDKKFTFEGKVEAPELYLIFVEGNQSPIAFFVENAKIEIKADIKEMQKAVVTGSDLTKVLNKFNDELPGLARSQELRQEYMQAQMSQDAEKMQALGEEMNSIMKNQIAYLDTFIGQNTNNALGALMLLNASSSLELAKFKTYAEEFKKNLPAHPYIKEIDTVLEQMAKYEQEQAAAAQMAPATEAPATETPAAE